MPETREGNKPVAWDKVTAGQELGNRAFSWTQLRYFGLSHPVTRNSGKEHRKHYLSQVTETADRYFTSCKAEVGGFGLGLGLGFFVCFVGVPSLPQLKRQTAFYSQESQQRLRLKAVQLSLFPGFISNGISHQSHKFHLVKRIQCADKR